MKKMEKFQVPMNLIEQKVFAHYVSPASPEEHKDYLQKEYVSQDEVVVSDGIKIKNTVQEYPITPESVNSYADGTNYRNDLSAAVSRGASGRNLGDVAAIQDLLTKNPQQVAEFFADALGKINAQKAQSEVKKEESNNG